MLNLDNCGFLPNKTVFNHFFWQKFWFRARAVTIFNSAARWIIRDFNPVDFSIIYKKKNAQIEKTALYCSIGVL